ncbi:ACT domain-containing protein [Gilbertella persicaria]|uniref:ACT domain-containing protein n=1 Tax=Gilbertella persicaria TaxID=101096 RepID=UPI00221F70D4|nr:ACT domain-containing protein [Gilbertella persicaria]KAI8084329.1 ACT domain-containing protein [Gilbertella persicaria]
MKVSFIFFFSSSIMSHTIVLKYLPEGFSVHQYERNHKVPTEIFDAPWYTLSKTKSELSLILPTEFQLSDIPNKSEDGWRMFQVDAQMDFGLVGILARIVAPLKDNSIPVFVVSTYDTDYVMIKQDKLEQAIQVLGEQPNMVVKQGESI